MSARDSKAGFTARPGDADRWVKTAEPSPAARRDPPPDAFTARITLDVTPALRRRLKLAAIAHGLTVADMLRALLAREFPDRSGDGS